jgi:hypothetical protein
MNGPAGIESYRAANTIEAGRVESNQVKRVTSLPADDRRQFPSAYKAITFEGEVINGVRHNAVTHVKVRAATAQEDVIAVLDLNTAVIPRIECA